MSVFFGSRQYWSAGSASHTSNNMFWMSGGRFWPPFCQSLLGWELLSLRKSLQKELIQCFEVRGIVRISFHHWKQQRDGVSQVGIWRKWTYKAFFLIILGLLSHPQQMETIPGHLKMILDHLNCHIKLGKEIHGKTWEHRVLQVRWKATGSEEPLGSNDPAGPSWLRGPQVTQQMKEFGAHAAAWSLMF